MLVSSLVLETVSSQPPQAAAWAVQDWIFPPTTPYWLQHGLMNRQEEAHHFYFLNKIKLSGLYIVNILCNIMHITVALVLGGM